MTFFFDNNFSRRIIESLRGAGYDVIHLQDRFAPRTRDVDWLFEAGRENWIVVTLDKKIVRRPAERLALLEANVTALFVHQAYFEMKGDEQLTWMLSRFPGIKKKALEALRGTLFRVHTDGTMDQIEQN